MSDRQAECCILEQLVFIHQNKAFQSYRSTGTNIHIVTQARHPSSAI